MFNVSFIVSSVHMLESSSINPSIDDSWNASMCLPSPIHVNHSITRSVDHWEGGIVDSTFLFAAGTAYIEWDAPFTFAFKFWLVSFTNSIFVSLLTSCLWPLVFVGFFFFCSSCTIFCTSFFSIFFILDLCLSDIDGVASWAAFISFSFVSLTFWFFKLWTNACFTCSCSCSFRKLLSFSNSFISFSFCNFFEVSTSFLKVWILFVDLTCSIFSFFNSLFKADGFWFNFFFSFVIDSFVFFISFISFLSNNGTDGLLALVAFSFRYADSLKWSNIVTSSSSSVSDASELLGFSIDIDIFDCSFCSIGIIGLPNSSWAFRTLLSWIEPIFETSIVSVLVRLLEE